MLGMEFTTVPQGIPVRRIVHVYVLSAPPAGRYAATGASVRSLDAAARVRTNVMYTGRT
jgi:hypothetical protein